MLPFHRKLALLSVARVFRLALARCYVQATVRRHLCRKQSHKATTQGALFILCMAWLLNGCAAKAVQEAPLGTPLRSMPLVSVGGTENQATLTPFQPLPPTRNAVPANEPSSANSIRGEDPCCLATLTAPTPGATAPSVAALWIAPYLPAAFKDSLTFPDGLAISAQPETAGLRLEVGRVGNGSLESPASLWIYALVAPFPTIEDGVSSKTLRECWKGRETGPFAGRPLLLDESTYEVFSKYWGEPAPGAVMVLQAEKLIKMAWKERPAWAIVPFELLDPRWKVLEVDGQSPVRKDFDSQNYPLAVPFWLSGPQSLVDNLRLRIPATNRDPSKLTTVALTGVTAMVRATAYLMERDGVSSPARFIGDWLREADITHISNEIPFTPKCPFPDPQQPGLRFCSHPRYIQLLEEIGVDVIELTGDHFADWGAEATLYTLELYRERGWPYYGGGENIKDGRKPVTFEHHGNRIAFIGCNGKGGGYATARENSPGAVVCDYDWMHAQIARLRKEGYLPIVTFQHIEVYSYKVPPQMREDFLGMAEAGAVIVSGSQAHQAHGMEFEGSAFLHFGLGNLFFDQYRFFSGPETDRAFIDRHVFYGGRYISTELLPITFISLSTARPMTPEERAAFLEEIFRASGW